MPHFPWIFGVISIPGVFFLDIFTWLGFLWDFLPGFASPGSAQGDYLGIILEFVWPGLLLGLDPARIIPFPSFGGKSLPGNF